MNTPIGTTRPSAISDRKSTRLNSSHVSISYAVFCLKKKKLPRLQNVQARDLHILSPDVHTVLEESRSTRSLQHLNQIDFQVFLTISSAMINYNILRS